MEWQKLDLTKASVVRKEVDSVLARLVELSNSPLDPDRAAIIASVQARVQDLENFFLHNSDDERAILFEKERLRLRKGLQPFITSSKDANKSVTGVSEKSASVGAASPPRGQQSAPERKETTQSLKGSVPAAAAAVGAGAGAGGGDSAAPAGVPAAPPRSSNGSVSNRSNATPNPGRSLSPGGSRRMPSVDRNIYAWEGGSNSVRQQRAPVMVDGVTFDPASEPGFYTRHQEPEENGMELGSDKFIDFQIVLTHEELTTLAARKKAEKADHKTLKNQMASGNVHIATPYVDPKRITQEMFRPHIKH